MLMVVAVSSPGKGGKVSESRDGRRQLWFELEQRLISIESDRHSVSRENAVSIVTRSRVKNRKYLFGSILAASKFRAYLTVAS